MRQTRNAAVPRPATDVHARKSHPPCAPVQLWDERTYRGNTTIVSEGATLAAHLSAELDKLAAQEHMSTPVLEMTQGHDPAVPYHGHRFGFVLEAEASRDLAQRDGVCGALEHDLGKPMDPKRNVLFIIGTQKGGTTYLFNALTKHPSFVGADHAFACALPGCGCGRCLQRVRSGCCVQSARVQVCWRNKPVCWLLDLCWHKLLYVPAAGSCVPRAQQCCWHCRQRHGPWAKEVHFFNRYPLPSPPKREYLKCFPPAAWNIDKLPNPNNFTLVDATPDYLFNAMAPPRIKALFSNAKFVVLLRVRRCTRYWHQQIAILVHLGCVGWPLVHQSACPCRCTRQPAVIVGLTSICGAPKPPAAVQHPTLLRCALQDPIARAYSAWTMSKRMSCRQQVKADPLQPCQFPTFAQMVVDEVKMLKKQGCTFGPAVRSRLAAAAPAAAIALQDSLRHGPAGPALFTSMLSHWVPQSSLYEQIMHP